MFAIWCAGQPRLAEVHAITQAVIARHIMNDVLAPVTPQEKRLPYLIWYPDLAAPTTYRELARRKPQMTPQILRACIHGDSSGYKELFDELLAAWPEVPDEAVVKDARLSADGSPHFTEALDRRIRELGATGPRRRELEWHLNPGCTVGSHSPSRLYKYMSMDTGLVGTERTSLCSGLRCDVSSVELLACLPEEWKVLGDAESGVDLDYVSWPPRDP
jgi:hypothetical protein